MTRGEETILKVGEEEKNIIKLKMKRHTQSLSRMLEMNGNEKKRRER